MSAPDATFSVTARYERDVAYRDAAVADTYAHRPAGHFIAPILIALAACYAITTSLITEVSVDKRWVDAWPTILFAILLIIVASISSYQAVARLGAQGFRFVGDKAMWQFDAQSVHYQLNDGTRLDCHYAWENFIGIRHTLRGLVLARSPVESYFIATNAFESSSDLEQALAWARGVGIPVKHVHERPNWSLIGTTIATACVLTLSMTMVCAVAALPITRFGRITPLMTSGLVTFWWIGLLLAASVVMPLHVWIARRGVHHLIAHGGLGALLSLVATGLLHWQHDLFFDEKLSQADVLAAAPLGAAGMLGALMGGIIHTHWVAGAAALRAR